MPVATEPLPQLKILPSVDDKGNSIFAVLVKRTYDIQPSGALARAEHDQPIRDIDEYYDDGDPETSTVKHESDMAPFKLATDVVVIGKAHAPNGEPAGQFDVAVSVGKIQRVIRIIGDRHCVYHSGRPPSFTDPIPATEMELRYERAYGGRDEKTNPLMPYYYPRNPMGKGLVLENARAQVEGLALPNLEDPVDLLTPERVVLEDLTKWNHLPLPRGFGWFQKTWYPRCSFVGSLPAYVDPDEVMQEERLGLVPLGQIALGRQFKLPRFDVRFNNGASLGLALPYLLGNEQLTLTHLTPEGSLQLSLPGDVPRIMLDISLGENELPPVLHTVCVRCEDMQVDLVWRGAHEYPGVDWLPELKRMRAEIS